jgi:hypothetical protein
LDFGSQFYGDGDLDFCIDLNGKIQPWTPPKNPFANIKESGIIEEIKKDSENYIRKNGLTKEIFDSLSDDEILHGGFFWAFDRIEERAKKKGVDSFEYAYSNELADIERILFSVGRLDAEIANGGFSQYLSNSYDNDFDLLIKSLTLVGAEKTAQLIKKSAKLMNDFDKKENKTDSDYEKIDERIENTDADLSGEDYVGLAIKYVKGKLNA